MEIKRERYMNQLISHMHNGLIKVVTGIRRSGKTYLLFRLFYNYLLKSGVASDHIIRLSLDDISNKKYRDAIALYEFIKSSIKDNDMHYVLRDEVQMANEFEDALNGLLHIDNVDTFVTGSNARFLSKDIITEFRGRGDDIHIAPLSFAEFMTAYDGSREDGWREYMIFGGLPKIFEFKTADEKSRYLKGLLTETYLVDIKNRNRVKKEDELSDVLDVVASSIGSLTNPRKIADTFKSVKHASIAPTTVQKYTSHMEDAFLIEEAKRYDIKGRKYIGSLKKYYFSDMGLRNARLNFRQIEETHLMENIIYNELRSRCENVDIGIVTLNKKDASGKSIRTPLEIDFVCNNISNRYYIQSALHLPTDEKKRQEARPLMHVNDSFKKIIISKDAVATFYNDDGILVMNLFDFLMNPNSLESV